MSQATPAALGTHQASTAAPCAKGRKCVVPRTGRITLVDATPSVIPACEGRNMCARRVTLLLLACAFATGAAAEYPDKSISLIVPQAAGSATDTVARILGAELGKELAQQIVVANRPRGPLTLRLA